MGAAIGRSAAPALVALALVIAAGCATPPAPRSPPPQLNAQVLGLAEASGHDPAAALDWWHAYGDPGLNRAVEQALAGHPTLALAQARIAQAQAAVAGAQAATAPRWEPGADATVQRFSAHGPVPPSVAGATRTLATVQLGMQWELDLFGRLKSELASAERAVAAAQQEQRAARAGLAAAVVLAWIDLADAQARWLSRQQELTLLEQMTALGRQRLAAGLDDARPLQQAEAERAALQERQAAAAGARERARRMLAALAAQPAEQWARAEARIPAAPPVPSLLDAGLLVRRGDVQAALARVEVTVNDLAATRALYYPSVNLHAVAGLSAIGLDRLLDLGSRQMGAGPALRLPLFDVPRLKALVQGREAAIDQAVAAYNERVVAAVREAGLALEALAAARQQLGAEQAALAQADAALALAQQRHAAGLAPLTDGLRARLARQRQQSQVEERQAQLLRDHAELMRALGGGPSGAESR